MRCGRSAATKPTPSRVRRYWLWSPTSATETSKRRLSSARRGRTTERFSLRLCTSPRRISNSIQPIHMSSCYRLLRTCRFSGSKRQVRSNRRGLDGEFAHQVPAFAIELAADDFRCFHKGLRHVRHGLLEVAAVDVVASGVVLEGFHQDVLVGVLQAAGPVEPQVARFLPGGLGEVRNEVRPAFRPFRLDLELDDDKDHWDVPSAARERAPSMYREVTCRCAARVTGPPAA